MHGGAAERGGAVVIAWLESRRVQRDRHDELFALRAIALLAPQNTRLERIAVRARLNPARTAAALGRLVQAGKVDTVWDAHTSEGQVRRVRLYRVVDVAALQEVPR
jgi:hypothetical protein